MLHLGIVSAPRSSPRACQDIRRRAHGFTLVESAIVMVIVSLVLSAMLKGQELLKGARVRSLITQQEGIKAAFDAFQDRYRALPGDYAAASTHVDCGGISCLNGDGNGRIEFPNSAGVQEQTVVWTHLSGAGLLTGSYSMSAATPVRDDGNTPRNPYGAFVQIRYDDNQATSGNTASRHNLKTGNQVPASVLAEVDRKIDDGRPYTGAFQFSAYAPSSSTPPNQATCLKGADWNILGGEENCGASRSL